MASATQEVEQFVRDALTAGASRQEVEAALVEAGWRPEQIRAPLAAWADQPFVVPVPRPRPYLSARDAFHYLVLFTTLYLTAWHLASLLFDIVGILLPDPADPEYRVLALPRSVRWSVATLLVAYPVFAFMAHRIAGELRRDPARRLSPVRRWLTYLTLFIAAGVLVGDLVALVYNVLGGELSLRFVLKVGIAGLVAGTVFGWYLTDLRDEERESAGGVGGRALVVAAGAAIIATVAVALALTGLPAEQRQARIDERRVQELMRLEAAIERHARQHDALPAALAALEGADVLSLADPATGQAYGYAALGDDRYRLCAAFAAASVRTDGSNDAGWAHPAGRHCFQRRVGSRDAPVR